MKQSKIKIQLECHQEIAKSALWCPFSFWNFAVSRVWRTCRPDHYFPRGPRRYPSCGQSILRTLLLAAVAVMAGRASDIPVPVTGLTDRDVAARRRDLEQVRVRPLQFNASTGQQ